MTTEIGNRIDNRSTGCRLCGHPTPRMVPTVRGVRLERCEQCDFLQVRDQPSPDALLELYGPAYFQHGKYRDEFALARENARRLQLLQSVGLASGSRILDAGCASGEFLAAASPRYEVWGVDVAESAVAEARRRCPAAAHRITSGFLEQQTFEPESFDSVVLWDVIEHVWDPVSVSKTVARWLKPGGVLVMSTPNVGSLTARVLGSRWAFLTVPEHLGLFSQQSMTLLVNERLGFRLRHWSSRGKWANVGFVFYKARRVAPRLVPEVLVRGLQRTPWSTLSMYVPTGDIQYVAAEKP